MPNETPSSASSSGSLLLPPYKGTVPKIEVLNMDDYRRDPTLLTVIFHEEDHTVGNALKHIIAQMPGVEFSGYNVPHPLEDKILVRVQTRKGVKAGDVLLKGLNDLGEVFEGIGRKFSAAYEAYQEEEEGGRAAEGGREREE